MRGCYSFIGLGASFALFIYLLLNVQINLIFDWWLALGIVTFLFYGYDKLQAKRRRWRVPERVLHLLALLGGFGGGWLGMVIFRHKIRKWFFLVVLGVSTGIHAWLYTML